MEQFDFFVGIFLAFSLVFLTSLYLKYGKRLKKRDSQEKGCPVHRENKTNIAITNDNTNTNNNELNNNQHDIHKLSKLLCIQPENETLINQSFEISLQILKSFPKNVEISTETQLELYGLFKQSNIGNINKKEPSQLYYVEHSKWLSWNKHKGKKKLTAKKEYFEFVYNKIIKPNNLNVLLFENDQQIPQDIKKQMNETKSQPRMSFAVNSKMEQFEFDEKLHGDPNELFNKFDLTEIDENDTSYVNEIKEYILENKIDINKQNENGTTFLNFAVDNNKYELSKLLIREFNANVNLSDDMGYAPLHCAAMNGNKQIIKLLLENGADIRIQSNDDNETPADLAESDDIKQLLTES